ncbi:hypothetical protein WJX81_003436 [Elliptochloris bilobata]|uniref:Uncharacterized protein n=1 Tax=Elliptochloris bilobata TaxID=381761 RepID=A0AAW1S1B9_9CHLO
MPGQGGEQGRQPSRLILPGQQRNGAAQAPQLGGGLAGLGLDANTNTPANPFRPPPGFMDSAPGQQAPAQTEDPQTMLNKIRADAGPWHQLAKLLPALVRAGIDATAVEAETGLERARQNVWAVSEQVYESLARSGEVPPDEMAYFDPEGGEDLLYGLRFLPIDKRPAIARFIVERQMDAAEAGVLARAVKEQERRRGEREGFSAAPGDCLAYKYFRDAFEAGRNEDARDACVRKGLKVAATEAAKAKLGQLSDEVASVAAAEAAPAKLQIVRLTREETAVRPIPLLTPEGGLTGADAATIASAPARPRQGGPFNAFCTDGGPPGQLWVALPAWNMMLLAQRPLAILLPDISQVDALVALSRARTDEERARFTGAGLLVIERAPDDAVDPDAYYAVPAAAGASGLVLVAAADLPEGAEPCGRVLFCCRPPAGGSSVLADTAEVIQL